MKTLKAGDKRRVSDARNAWRKATEAQRLEILAFITVEHRKESAVGQHVAKALDAYAKVVIAEVTEPIPAHSPVGPLQFPPDWFELTHLITVYPTKGQSDERVYVEAKILMASDEHWLIGENRYGMGLVIDLNSDTNAVSIDNQIVSALA